MRIDHVAIAVRSIDASLSWYVDYLGLTLVGDELLPQLSVRLAYLDTGGALLQLVQPLGPCPVADFLAERGEGLHHICLAVPDIPATLQRMAGQQQVTITMGGRGGRACFLAAVPNGLRIEFTEMAPFGGGIVPGDGVPS